MVVYNAKLSAYLYGLRRYMQPRAATTQVLHCLHFAQHCATYIVHETNFLHVVAVRGSVQTINTVLFYA